VFSKVGVTVLLASSLNLEVHMWAQDSLAAQSWSSLLGWGILTIALLADNVEYSLFWQMVQYKSGDDASGYPFKDTLTIVLSKGLASICIKNLPISFTIRK